MSKYYGNITCRRGGKAQYTHHLGRDLGNCGGDRFTGATIVRHLEFDRIANLEVLRVATELAEVEKKASLPLAALDETVRVEKLLDNAGLADGRVVGGVV